MHFFVKVNIYCLIYDQTMNSVGRWICLKEKEILFSCTFERHTYMINKKNQQWWCNNSFIKFFSLPKRISSVYFFPPLACFTMRWLGMHILFPNNKNSIFSAFITIFLLVFTIIINIYRLYNSRHSNISVRTFLILTLL